MNNEEPKEMKVPTTPFDIGFADTQYALDVEEELPNCVYQPGTKEADEWWLGRQAALDEHELEKQAENSVGYRLFSALVDAIVFEFASLCVLVVSTYAWFTYKNDMHFVIQCLVISLMLRSGYKLLDHFVASYINEKGN